MTSKEKYNGWKNRSTWNVALYILNDYSLYMGAVEYMKANPESKHPYLNFIKSCGLDTQKTPDRIQYMSDQLDYTELNEMMKELLS
jgi:hypothetical protein